MFRLRYTAIWIYKSKGKLVNTFQPLGLPKTKRCLWKSQTLMDFLHHPQCVSATSINNIHPWPHGVLDHSHHYQRHNKRVLIWYLQTPGSRQPSEQFIKQQVNERQGKPPIQPGSDEIICLKTNFFFCLIKINSKKYLRLGAPHSVWYAFVIFREKFWLNPLLEADLSGMHLSRIAIGTKTIISW